MILEIAVNPKHSQTHGPLEAPEPCFCPCSAACTVMYQAVAVWHELRVFHAGSFLHHGCVDALQPVHSLRSVGCVWTCLGVHGRQPIFWSPCLHVGTSRCLFFWYSFCSVLIGSAWFRSCWQEKPHVDCCNSEFCVVSRLTCVLTVATSTPVIRFDPIGFPWISKRTRKRKGA